MITRPRSWFILDQRCFPPRGEGLSMGEPSLDDSNVKVAVRVRPMNRRGEMGLICSDMDCYNAFGKGNILKAKARLWFVFLWVIFMWNPGRKYNLLHLSNCLPFEDIFLGKLACLKHSLVSFISTGWQSEIKSLPISEMSCCRCSLADLDGTCFYRLPWGFPCGRLPSHKI